MSEEIEQSDNIALDKPHDWWSLVFWPLFFIIVGATAFWMFRKSPAQTTIFMPTRDLPPYRLLTTTDFVTKTVDATQLSADTVREATGLVSHYAVMPLLAGEPVKAQQLRSLANAQLLTQTVAIGLPATPAMALNGNLQAGQSVDIMLVSTMTQSVTTPPIYENLLVLDVKATNAAQAERTVNAQPPFVIVLAIPLAKRNEFSIAYGKATTILVALHP
ncbi:MAG: SAF domain-containing protein [Caldilineaceae bacterium]